MKTRKRRRGFDAVKWRAKRELRHTIASLPELDVLVRSLKNGRVVVPLVVPLPDDDAPLSLIVATAVDRGLQLPVSFTVMPTETGQRLDVGDPDGNGNEKGAADKELVSWFPGPAVVTDIAYVRKAVARMRSKPASTWLQQPSKPTVEQLANTTVSKRYIELFGNHEARDWCLRWLLPRLAVPIGLTFLIGWDERGTSEDAVVEQPEWTDSATDNYVTWSKLNVLTVKRDWNVYDVNAFYEQERNRIVVPNAFLGFYVPGDDAANLATLGTSIGHEMAHARDHDGPRPTRAQLMADERRADSEGFQMALRIVNKEGLDEGRFRRAYARHWPRGRKRGDVHAAGTQRTRLAFGRK